MQRTGSAVEVAVGVATVATTARAAIVATGAAVAVAVGVATVAATTGTAAVGSLREEVLKR